MAYRGKTMRQIKEMIRLCVCCKMTYRQAGRAVRVAHKIVSRNVRKYLSLGMSWEKFEKLDEERIQDLFHKRKGVDTRYQELEKEFPYIEKELGRKGVTLRLLWEEYKQGRLFWYEYSQFCYHYQTWRGVRAVRLHIEHKAGDKMFVDFAGKKLEITERKTGAKQEVEVFVAVLGWSQMTYVEATESQKIPDWIRLNANALIYFEGAPAAIVPDNLKSGVRKANRYEPKINRTYEEFARHYQTVILPARVRKYRDKALVEGAVNIVYQRIYAKLRNEAFYSLDDLNERIWELLEEHNGKRFQKNDGTRRSLYEEVEKATLKPLPAEPFEYRQHQKARVVYNYHVMLSEDKHWYSVPFRYHKKQVILAYTARNVEIYLGEERIAMHRRAYGRWKYTTLAEHMPSHHRFWAEWTPERVANWAGETGPATRKMVEMIMKRCGHPEQGFNMSMGVIELGKKNGKVRLEQACERAMKFQAYTYRTVKNILEKGLEKEQRQQNHPALPEHENTRGSTYYN